MSGVKLGALALKYAEFLRNTMGTYRLHRPGETGKVR